jgi:hypothetical protein
LHLALLGTYFFGKTVCYKRSNQKPSETKTEIEVQWLMKKKNPVEKETAPKEVSKKPEIEKPQEKPQETPNNNPEIKTVPSQIQQ